MDERQRRAFEWARGLEQQGQLEPALSAYVELRQYAEAAHVARRLGRAPQAAELYAEAGMPSESADAYLAAGESGKALEQLMKVPRDHPAYRRACVEAIRLAAAGNDLRIELEHLISRFIRSGPQGEEELGAFYALGKLYAAHGFQANAREAFTKILAAHPGYADADALLRSLGPSVSSTLPGAPALEGLPDLPDVPSLPQPPRIPVPGRQATPGPPAGSQVTPSRASAKAAPFAVGDTVAERYLLKEKVGQGGMAVVFRATDLDLGDEIALKIFTQAVFDEETESRFKRELRLSRHLVHPNVIRLFDIGFHGGFRYISMELLVGQDLRERMVRRLPLAEALDYLVQAAAGLQAAHDQGVVHRDVKPENFFVTDAGVLKIMDFGIAKVQAAPGVTTTGIIAGTPAYMSPEQIGNFSGVTSASDLYALGVVAYEVLTGTLPFRHADPMPLLMMHLNDPPESLRTHDPALPVELDDAILRLLEKDPARRFPSASDFAERLKAIRGEMR